MLEVPVHVMSRYQQHHQHLAFLNTSLYFPVDLPLTSPDAATQFSAVLVPRRQFSATLCYSRCLHETRRFAQAECSENEPRPLQATQTLIRVLQSSVLRIATMEVTASKPAPLNLSQDYQNRMSVYKFIVLKKFAHHSLLDMQ